MTGLGVVAAAVALGLARCAAIAAEVETARIAKPTRIFFIMLMSSQKS
jgi:hypothetical protein